MKTVLLAAHPESMTAAMCLVLRPSKALRLLHAGSIEQVVDCLMEAHGRIDLLVADIAFPGACAIDLALNLRAIFPRLRILFASENSTLHCTPRQRNCLLAMPPGTFAHLRAPVAPAGLRRKIDGLLAPLLSKVA